MTIRTAIILIAWYIRTCVFRGWASFWSNPYEVEARAAKYGK